MDFYEVVNSLKEDVILYRFYTIIGGRFNSGKLYKVREK